MIQARHVIVCGGLGTTIWPFSRAGYPKQFLFLTGEESLFQQATKRLVALGNSEIALGAPYIVANERHRFQALTQLREIGVDPGAALLEPVGRGTAPAPTLAALAAVENGDDSVLVVTPADQTVADASPVKRHHRAEHWVVVKGSAEIASGDKTILHTENQSTYIR